MRCCTAEEWIHIEYSWGELKGVHHEGHVAASEIFWLLFIILLLLLLPSDISRSSPSPTYAPKGHLCVLRLATAHYAVQERDWVSREIAEATLFGIKYNIDLMRWMLMSGTAESCRLRPLLLLLLLVEQFSETIWVLLYSFISWPWFDPSASSSSSSQQIHRKLQWRDEIVARARFVEMAGDHHHRRARGARRKTLLE